MEPHNYQQPLLSYCQVQDRAWGAPVSPAAALAASTGCEQGAEAARAPSSCTPRALGVKHLCSSHFKWHCLPECTESVCIATVTVTIHILQHAPKELHAIWAKRENKPEHTTWYF